jgi:hypothetical protein
LRPSEFLNAGYDESGSTSIDSAPHGGAPSDYFVGAPVDLILPIALCSNYSSSQRLLLSDIASPLEKLKLHVVLPAEYRRPELEHRRMRTFGVSPPLERVFRLNAKSTHASYSRLRDMKGDGHAAKFWPKMIQLSIHRHGPIICKPYVLMSELRNGILVYSYVKKGRASSSFKGRV